MNGRYWCWHALRAATTAAAEAGTQRDAGRALPSAFLCELDAGEGGRVERWEWEWGSGCWMRAGSVVVLFVVGIEVGLLGEIDAPYLRRLAWESLCVCQIGS